MDPLSYVHARSGVTQQSLSTGWVYPQQQIGNQYNYCIDYQSNYGRVDTTTAHTPAPELINPKQVTKESNMIREYVKKHMDLLFTVTMALLIDQFILGGALRHRIQSIVEAALNRVEASLKANKKE